MIIKIYVNKELKDVCINEFTAMNNAMQYIKLYGKENVHIVRTNENFEDALKEKCK